ncbi:MAG: phosphatase PAP2 family protein [Candidatus Aenigmarchaeota archaeon]|nr:phosphatase PAP2 family protein [Candidatus Aenigmarchaeota archaeon]
MNLKKFYLDSAMRDITSLGTIYYFILIAGALFSLGHTQLSYKLAVAQILMYAVTIPAKLLFFRNRPGIMKHSNLIEKIEASSFPSVHTVRAFFVSYMLAAAFGSAALTAALSVLALLVAYSRIYLKRHYYRDIAAGAAIGLIIGYGVMEYV